MTTHTENLAALLATMHHTSHGHITLTALLADYKRAVEALRRAPVYSTTEGVWFNFRGDTKNNEGGAMIKIGNITEKESEVVHEWKSKCDKALSASERWQELLEGK